ncbi:TerD family protein [Streptomyces sp. Amel2xB2]|uniref:TerD family protein n=1 Tax=Streptomyces sp. Amel2xB2 TaxID=1305829 RepID=UPI000DBA5581|nr:TerD family protein [Streptomyces sp. Amel2xB2]
MTKGANVSLASLSDDADAVTVGLTWTSDDGDGDADVSVLLLAPDGRVRSDADFFFYNNPSAHDGSVQVLGTTPTIDGSEDRVSLDLSAIAPGVSYIVVAASRYQGGRFGELDDLRLTVTDAGGERLLGYTLVGAADESAIVFGEFYRRGAEWKFRAVGQGYDTGLAGLATDFGIDVDDEQPDGERTDGEAGDGPTAASPFPGGVAPPGEQPPPRPASGATTAAGLSVTIPAPAPTSAAVPVPVPVPDTVPASVPEQPLPRRPRTARKKITLPKAEKKSLAENDSWHRASLFPVSSLKSDREREARATSVLLSVMAQVPEFGRRLTAPFGAPAGRMETYVEVVLPNGEAPRRPDGVIRVERAGKLWTALLESKTNGAAVQPQQVQEYVDIAARRGYEAVITLSNDVALDGTSVVDVKIDARRKHKVALWHLSWAEVAHQARMLIHHEGVGSASHAWLLQELLFYLSHDNSGCHGFQNMGPAWVPVRNGIDDETLSHGDPRALDVVESWERLVRQVCLRLGGELGQKVLPVQRGATRRDPIARRTAGADQLCERGRLFAELRIEGTQGILALTADLRTARLRTSLDVPAPEQGYPLTWAKRLTRQLAEAPADLHIETLLADAANGPRGTLERLRPEPGDMLPKDDVRITGFRLSLFKGMGGTRGNAESGFIRSVDQAVDRFCTTVVAPLDRSRTARGSAPRQQQPSAVR